MNASRYIDDNETLQGRNTLSNIGAGQHTLVVLKFTCVHTVLAKEMFWLGTNIIDYKFEIH